MNTVIFYLPPHSGPSLKSFKFLLVFADFLKKDLPIYLRDREHTQWAGRRDRERESPKQTPSLLSAESYTGLDPTTPRP